MKDPTPLALWGPPKLVETKNGLRLLLVGIPEKGFWEAWRYENAELRAAGVTCHKNPKTDVWEVNWWQIPTEPIPAPPSLNAFDATLPDPLQCEGRFKLRQYQDTAAEMCAQCLTTSGENGLGILPTGAGKSLVIASIVRRLDKPCLVMQPTKEILEQNYSKLVGYGFRPSIYSASFGRKEIGSLTLATIGSIKRAELFERFRYVLVDECHVVNAKGGMYSEFFESLPEGARVLGLTATPYRLTTDGFGGSILKFLTRTRPRVFSKVACYVQTGDLFEAGYLCPLDYRAAEPMGLRDGFKFNSTGADYTDKSVEETFERLQFKDRVLEVVKSLLREGRKNVLVFTRFISESRYLVEKLGEHAAIVTADTHPITRARIIREFRAGITKVVSNVGVLSIGFDFPALETVVLASPTLSLARYYQFVGRAVRTEAGKERAVIVDMVGLVSQFGKVEDLRLVDSGNGKWIVKSEGRQLTNIYYGRKPEEQPDYSSEFESHTSRTMIW